MKNGGASAPHAIIVCAHASGLVIDIRFAPGNPYCAFLLIALTRLSPAMDSMGAEADKAGCSRDELAAAGKKILELFEDHGAHNNICYQKKKELGTCTRIEIKGTCGTTEVITASMSC